MAADTKLRGFSEILWLGSGMGLDRHLGLCRLTCVNGNSLRGQGPEAISVVGLGLATACCRRQLKPEVRYPLNAKFNQLMFPPPSTTSFSTKPVPDVYELVCNSLAVPFCST